MTTYLGNSGVIKIGSNAIAEVTSFGLTATEGVVEDTAQGDAAKTFLADGLPTFTVQIAAHYYPGDTNGQALIIEGATLSLVLNLIGTTTGLQKLSGSAIVTQVVFGDSGNAQVVPFTATLQGTGALTRGTN